MADLALRLWALWNLPVAGRAVLILTVGSGALAVLLVPRGARRMPVLGSVLAGVAAMVALFVVRDPLLGAAVVLVLAGLHSALPGLTSFATRFRAPAYGALLVILGSLAVSGSSNAALTRLAGLVLVLGVTAVIGVAPYLQGLDARQPAAASAIAWLGFCGPSLAVLLVTRLLATLPPEAAPAYVAILVGIGVLNLAVGAIGAWQASSPADLWRHSFVADWGLILVALGVLNPSASAGADLLLAGILLFRLPLYLLARPVLASGGADPVDDPNASPASKPILKPGLITIVLAAALAGGPPFAGFPARLLVLRGASQAAWPLAVLLVVGMLAWLPLSVNLARSIGRPTGRVLAGTGLLLLINLAIGVYPAPLLTLFGAR